jgi:hypothetical protein
MQGLPLMKGRGCIAYYHQGCLFKIEWGHHCRYQSVYVVLQGAQSSQVILDFPLIWWTFKWNGRSRLQYPLDMTIHIHWKFWSWTSRDELDNDALCGKITAEILGIIILIQAAIIMSILSWTPFWLNQSQASAIVHIQRKTTSTDFAALHLCSLLMPAAPMIGQTFPRRASGPL